MDHTFWGRKPARHAREARGGSSSRVSEGVKVALIVVAALLLIYFLGQYLRRHRDGFASQRAQEVYATSRDLFERTGGKATYSEFKTSVPGAEAVLYTDARSLWKQGKLTPERLQPMV